MLADIGVAILSNALGEQYDPIATRYRPKGLPFTDDEERESVGVTHAEVSAMVLSGWGLPETICMAVNLQQSLTVKPVDAATRIARILNASDRIAALLCEVPEPDMAAITCAEAMAFINVDLKTLVNILDDIEKDVEELASILRTDVIPTSAYDLIAQSVQRQLTPAPA